MKSFTEHELDREQLDEELNKKVKIDEATAGDFLLGLGVAGGLLALKKGWDKWGKGSKLHRKVAAKFGTAQMKRDADQAAADKDDIAQADKERSAKADTAGLEKDSEGNLKNQKDAQAYKDKTKKAPSGWETSPEDSPGKGEVWKAGENDKWKETKAKLDAKDAEGKAKKDADAAADRTKSNKAQRKQEKGRKAAKKSGVFGKGGTSAKSQKKAARKAMIKKATGSESFIPDCISILSDLTEDFTKEDRTQLLEELVLEETMTLEESNELQAIMALDDAGISAEINRKGQVVVKKKDLKKAEKALKKSFKKGGEPKLVGEETLGDVLDQIVVEAELEEASSKKARNKAADEIEAIADKGGAEAPALFRLASKLRKGTHSTTGLKLSKKVTAILKVNGIKEDVQKPRTAYELVSEARKRSIKNKPQWEQE
jgi:hypothetical protein